jgi:NACHT C-terminal Alpha/Beta 2/NACHT domain
VKNVAVEIGSILIVWIIRKFCDGALRQLTNQIFGSKEKRALRKAVSIAIDKFKGEYPTAFGGLFRKKLFWSALEEEFTHLLDPNSQPNIEELARKVESVSPVKKEELQECLNRLFEILRKEIVKQPDLRAVEQIRLLLKIENNLAIPTTDEIDAKARIASGNDIERLQSFLNIPSKIIEIGSHISAEKEQLISNDDIVEFLKNGYNIILEAEPGAGKSTTLYQIAQSMLDKGEEVFPIFLSLTNWLSNKSFLEFIARENDAFNEQQLSIDDIRTLARHGHLVFIIDGWNELSREKLKEARINIDNLQKDYPNSGMLIATRSVSLPPKLNMSEQITLNRLDRDKRNEIICSALENPKADELITHICNKAALRQISQTPFYLDKLIAVYQANGSLPETREALLNICAHVNDDKEAIVEILNRRHHSYMIALAVEMFKAGTTELKNDAACQIISSVSQNLKNNGKFDSPPDSQNILEALAKYHLLINLNNGKSWKFQHQQFQEWYASYWIEELIISASEGNADNLKKLRNEVLNIPLWEEALFFAIERLAGQAGQQDKLAMVVINALEIDPLLSAEIIALSDEVAWSKVQGIVLGYLDRWHRPEKIEPDRSLSFMIASGRPEFAEKVWPLIANEYRQIRLPALRMYSPFRIGCLGAEWTKELEKHSEEIRDDILSQIAHYGGIEELDAFTELAVASTSTKIKVSVLEAAYFRGSQTHIQRILENAQADVWKRYHSFLDPEEMDEQAKAQIISIAQEDLDSTTKNISRLRLCLKLWELGVTDIKDTLFESLANLEDEQDPNWNLYQLIEKISKIDKTITANTLVNRFVQGRKLGYRYEEFTLHADKEHRKKLADYIVEGNENFSERTTAAKALHKDGAILLLKKLLELSDEAISFPRRDVPENLRNKINGLKRTLKNIPERFLVEGIAQLNGSKWEIAFTKAKNFCRSLLGKKSKNNGTILKTNHISELAGLFAWPESGQGNQPDSHRLELPDELSDSFRDILRNWSYILRNNDKGFGHRHELSEISMVLGRVGNEEDVYLVNELLQYDLDYRNNLLQEWERNGRRGQRPNGMSMSYTNLYRRAFEAMPHKKVVETVTPHLNNPEFCKEAAYIIRHAWFVENGLLSRDTNWSSNPDFSKVSENVKKLENQERPDPHPYINNVLNRIEELLPQQEDKKVKGMLFDLSPAIADTEYGNKVYVLETVIGLEGLGKYACLMKLIQKGEKIGAAIIKPCCETIRQEWDEQHWNQTNEWYRVAQWLELLALSDDPMQVMDLVKDLPTHMQQERTFDRVINGLRYSSSEDAEKTLLALAEAFPELEKNGDWLKAMYDQLTEASHKYFYKILWDPNKAKHHAKLGRGPHDPFVNIIEKIIKANPEIRKDFIEKFETPMARQLLNVMNSLLQRFKDDDEIIHASLLLLNNSANMLYGIEGYVTHREPIDESSNTFTVVPSSATGIRKRLLEMLASDLNRSIAAKHVLAAIDELRDEHGRPENEPRHPDLESDIPWPLVVQNE